MTELEETCKEVDLLQRAIDELTHIMHDEKRTADDKVTDSIFVLNNYKR